MALTSGLVAYYKLDESSGNATDSVGGYTATNNSVTYGAALINNWGVFNGSASYFSMASNLWLNGSSQNYTYSLWARPTSNMSAQTVFFNNVDVTFHNYNYIEFYLWAMRLIRVRGWIAADVLNVTQAMNASTWYHIAGTYNWSTLNLYINGTSIGTASSTGNGSSGYSNQSSIWADVTGATKFDWKIDEVGVWNRALSSGEITSLYNWWAGIQYPFSTGNSNFFLFMT